MREEDVELIDWARRAMRHAFAEYSGFPVGAAVRTARGKVYTGANVEISSFGLSLCAERVALFKAYSEGERDIEALAVAGVTDEPISPCGACRQVIWELAPHARILLVNRDASKTAEFAPRDLLPDGFSLNRRPPGIRKRE